jgi:hypothetical protein
MNLGNNKQNNFAVEFISLNYSIMYLSFLSSVHTDQALLQTFPNVCYLLYLMNIIPASTASVERSFSYMNLIKTPLRSDSYFVDKISQLRLGGYHMIKATVDL